MNIFESLLEEVLNEALAKVKHSRIRVKRQSAVKRAKAKKFRIKNKNRLKLKLKKLRTKLKSRPKPKKGFAYDSKGRLHKRQIRVGLRKR